MTIKAECAILCDDVRTESNGKILAIGIYKSAVQVDEFPCILSLVFLVGIDVLEAKKVLLEFKVSSNGQKIRHIKGDLEGSVLGRDWIPVATGHFAFESESEISLSSRIDNGRWKSLLKTRVELRPDKSNPIS